MNVNLFQTGITYVNDPDDFRIPYKIQGKIDREIMMDKYGRLRKASYGYIVRLGIGVKY